MHFIECSNTVQEKRPCCANLRERKARQGGPRCNRHLYGFGDERGTREVERYSALFTARRGLIGAIRGSVGQRTGRHSLGTIVTAAAYIAMQHGAVRRRAMFFPWYKSMLLAGEAAHVIGLRLIAMSGGGRAALDEAQLMVSEKIAASWEAGATLIDAGDAHAVIDRYRQHVASNAARLTRS